MAQAVYDLEPIHVGQTEVENEQIDRVTAELFERAFAICASII